MKWQTAAILLTLIIVGGSGLVTYTDLFGVLFQLSGVSYSHSGDISCSRECESFIEVNTSYWRICFAHYNGTKYENETIFKKVSRSRTLHANLALVDNIIVTSPRIEVDWLVPARGRGNWRLIKDGDCWDRKKVNKIKLVGHKEPWQTVKWGFVVGEYVDVDPVWFGVGKRTSITQLDTCWNVTEQKSVVSWRIEWNTTLKEFSNNSFIERVKVEVEYCTPSSQFSVVIGNETKELDFTDFGKCFMENSCLYCVSYGEADIVPNCLSGKHCIKCCIINDDFVCTKRNSKELFSAEDKTFLRTVPDTKIFGVKK